MSVVNSALRNLGPRYRRQPDWFAENEETVSTMLKERNHLYQIWLTTQKEEDKDKFKKARAKTRKHLRKIKEDWFKSKAELAEKGRFNGRLTWQCIKDLQHGRSGPRKIVAGIIEDEQGNRCNTLQEQHNRW